MKISLTFQGEKTLDPGGFAPRSRGRRSVISQDNLKRNQTQVDYAILIHKSLELKLQLGVALPKAAVVQFEDSLGEDKTLVVDHRS